MASVFLFFLSDYRNATTKIFLVICVARTCPFEMTDYPGKKGVGKESLTSFEMGELRYQQGLLLAQQGRLREAINAFGKASFFLPHKPQPFFAAAECFVSLCDFKGAVKQYRRALWLLRPRDDTESVEHPFGSALQPEKPSRCSDFSGRVSAFSIIEGEKDEGRESDHNDDFMLSTTDSSSRIATAEATPPPSAFRARAAAAAGDDRAIAGAVKTRLAGILDALSIVLFNVKDYGQALRFADDSLELCEHPQVMLHRCAYLVALERSDEAEKALEKHLKEHPCFFIESSSLLVHLYCQRQAFRHAKELLESVPLNDRQHAQIVLAQRIFDDAYSVFRQRSIDQSDVQGLTRCLGVFPEDPALSFERAKYHISKGMDKKAVPDLFRCIKISDGSYKNAVELMTETLFRLGAGRDGKDGIKDAIEYYSTSLLWHADNIPVLLARGDCYAKLGDYKNALQDFLSVERIFPKHSGATERIARLHDVWGTEFHARGKLEEAEQEFSRAIATCETEPLFYYHRARCRFDMGEPRYALRDVLSCRELNAEDPVIRDFVHAHLSFMTQGSEGQSSGSANLPKVLLHATRRAIALYGNDAANAARRLRQQRSEQLQALEQEEHNAVALRDAGDARRGKLPALLGVKTSHTAVLGGVLTCSKVQMSTPEGKLKSQVQGRSRLRGKN
ncbi:hypothetical protein C3747_57g268 [Trypanosoma cruzi]|uniref:Tetratricopeptide repeat-containing protein n=1 Tax=Trypanosoma cruzi TaxID=5693 RepID=A0A2V2WSP8_TRYCR|nr:hypothetical protein C3747_57g268 [Trypanosoma cruzi]